MRVEDVLKTHGIGGGLKKGSYIDGNKIKKVKGVELLQAIGFASAITNVVIDNNGNTFAYSNSILYKINIEGEVIATVTLSNPVHLILTNEGDIIVSHNVFVARYTNNLALIHSFTFPGAESGAVLCGVDYDLNGNIYTSSGISNRYWIAKFNAGGEVFNHTVSQGGNAGTIGLKVNKVNNFLLYSINSANKIVKASLSNVKILELATTPYLSPYLFTEGNSIYVSANVLRSYNKINSSIEEAQYGELSLYNLNLEKIRPISYYPSSINPNIGLNGVSHLVIGSNQTPSSNMTFFADGEMIVSTPGLSHSGASAISENILYFATTSSSSNLLEIWKQKEEKAYQLI